jgi:hypothetical protein
MRRLLRRPLKQEDTMTQPAPQREHVAQSSTDGYPVQPHVAEFAAELSSYLADDSILLTDVFDESFGRVDVVVVGRDATIGFVFGSAAVREGMPNFVDELYSARAMDVAYGSADILYVAAREFATLFRSDSRLRLVPYCSERVLAWHGRRQNVITAQGDDGQPFIIRSGSIRKVDRPAKPATSRRETRTGRRSKASVFSSRRIS